MAMRSLEVQQSEESGPHTYSTSHCLNDTEISAGRHPSDSLSNAGAVVDRHISDAAATSSNPGTSPTIFSEEAQLVDLQNPQWTVTSKRCPILNIHSPTEGGISWNRIQPKDQHLLGPEKGLLLNQQLHRGSSPVWGDVLDNPYLHETTARVIVCSFPAELPCRLEDHITVLGKPADVVVTHPEEISCVGDLTLENVRSLTLIAGRSLYKEGLQGKQILSSASLPGKIRILEGGKVRDACFELNPGEQKPGCWGSLMALQFLSHMFDQQGFVAAPKLKAIQGEAALQWSFDQFPSDPTCLQSSEVEGRKPGISGSASIILGSQSFLMAHSAITLHCEDRNGSLHVHPRSSNPPCPAMVADQISLHAGSSIQVDAPLHAFQACEIRSKGTLRVGELAALRVETFSQRPVEGYIPKEDLTGTLHLCAQGNLTVHGGCAACRLNLSGEEIDCGVRSRLYGVELEMDSRAKLHHQGEIVLHKMGNVNAVGDLEIGTDSQILVGVLPTRQAQWRDQRKHAQALSPSQEPFEQEIRFKSQALCSMAGWLRGEGLAVFEAPNVDFAPTASLIGGKLCVSATTGSLRCLASKEASPFFDFLDVIELQAVDRIDVSGHLSAYSIQWEARSLFMEDAYLFWRSPERLVVTLPHETDCQGGVWRWESPEVLVKGKKFSGTNTQFSGAQDISLVLDHGTFQKCRWELPGLLELGQRLAGKQWMFQDCSIKAQAFHYDAHQHPVNLADFSQPKLSLDLDQDLRISASRWVGNSAVVLPCALTCDFKRQDYLHQRELCVAGKILFKEVGLFQQKGTLQSTQSIEIEGKEVSFVASKTQAQQLRVQLDLRLDLGGSFTPEAQIDVEEIFLSARGLFSTAPVKFPSSVTCNLQKRDYDNTEPLEVGGNFYLEGDRFNQRGIFKCGGNCTLLVSWADFATKSRTEIGGILHATCSMELVNWGGLIDGRTLRITCGRRLRHLGKGRIYGMEGDLSAPEIWQVREGNEPVIAMRKGPLNFWVNKMTVQKAWIRSYDGPLSIQPFDAPRDGSRPSHYGGTSLSNQSGSIHASGKVTVVMEKINALLERWKLETKGKPQDYFAIGEKAIPGERLYRPNEISIGENNDVLITLHDSEKYETFRYFKGIIEWKEESIVTKPRLAILTSETALELLTDELLTEVSILGDPKGNFSCSALDPNQSSKQTVRAAVKQIRTWRTGELFACSRQGAPMDTTVGLTANAIHPVDVPFRVEHSCSRGEHGGEGIPMRVLKCTPLTLSNDEEETEEPYSQEILSRKLRAVFDESLDRWEEIVDVSRAIQKGKVQLSPQERRDCQALIDEALRTLTQGDSDAIGGRIFEKLDMDSLLLPNDGLLPLERIGSLVVAAQSATPALLRQGLQQLSERQKGAIAWGWDELADATAQKILNAFNADKKQILSEALQSFRHGNPLYTQHLAPVYQVSPGLANFVGIQIFCTPSGLTSPV